jgi:DNA-binding XRE family transcriptional regulator
VKKKWRRDYPVTTQSIGDQIKKKRYDAKFLQSEVASIFGVSEDTIRNWEKGKSFPQLNYFPKIIEFLGYNPFLETQNPSIQIELKDHLFRFRRMFGISGIELGKLLNVHSTTILSWEKGLSMPSKMKQKNIVNKISALSESMTKSTNHS